MSAPRRRTRAATRRSPRPAISPPPSARPLGGRRSRAEELQLQEQRARIRWPDLAKAKSERDVIRYLGKVSNTLGQGLITQGEAKERGNLAAITLRAIRSQKQGEELERYEELIKRDEALEESRRRRASRSRQHREGAEKKPEKPPTNVIQQALRARGAKGHKEASPSATGRGAPAADVAKPEGDPTRAPSAPERRDAALRPDVGDAAPVPS